MVFQLLLVILYKVCFHTVAEDGELLHFQILLPPPKNKNIFFKLNVAIKSMVIGIGLIVSKKKCNHTKPSSSN